MQLDHVATPELLTAQQVRALKKRGQTLTTRSVALAAVQDLMMTRLMGERGPEPTGPPIAVFSFSLPKSPGEAEEVPKARRCRDGAARSVLHTRVRWLRSHTAHLSHSHAV
jgi:hypothetical protein